jgi:16S rRNA (guanine527-N7)-methyltransferase
VSGIQDFDTGAWRARLAAGAAGMGVTLDAAQTDALCRFAQLLRERNQQVNLTAIDSWDGMLTLHMLDSLSVVPHLGAARRIIDVGTGGGFPGIPIAVACPQREVVLIDGTQKKIRFVTEVIEALGLRNACAMAARAESFTGEKGFDAVVLRAVGALADVLHKTAPLLSPAGRLLAMKGRVPDDELRALPRGWHAEVTPLRVPGLDAERHLVAVSRQREAR